MSGPNPPHTSRRRLLTTAEVAEDLNVSLRTVRRLIKNGELPIVRVGRAVRIRPEALGAFIDGERHQILIKDNRGRLIC